MVESSSNVLDGTVFHELLESLNEPAAVAAIYRKFIENAAAFISELRDQEDAARSETLHTLKGSAAMMGATRMAKLAAHLQAQVQHSSIPIASAIEQLESELEKFRQALDAQLLSMGERGCLSEDT